MHATSQRRGIVLLIVLTLLTLFLLMTIALAIVASQGRATSASGMKWEQFEDPPQTTFDVVLMQLVRGSRDRTSPFQIHSVLEDLYGNESITGTISAVNYRQGLLVIPCDGLSIPSPNDHPAHDVIGGYVGRVLTMTSGPAAGRSSIVVRHAPDPSTSTTFALWLYPFEGTYLEVTNDGSGTTVNYFGGPAVGDSFILNGRAYSGTGMGFEFAAGQTPPLRPTALTLDGTNRPVALAPNPAAPAVFGYLSSLMPANQFFDLLRPNEPYDAPDFQNMYLGVAEPVFIADPTTAPNVKIPIPSFHRPDLIRYWLGASDWFTLVDTTPQLAQAICMRPIRHPNFHPAFTGSNPAFHPVTGPWDVDNNRDGIPDSIWMDPGFPVRTAADGTPYKMLVAPLIIDLDGRLNLNAHGSLEQAVLQAAAANGDTEINAAVAAYGLNVAGTPKALLSGPWAGGGTSVNLPRGYGRGPAEVDLGVLFSNKMEYVRLLTGDSQRWLEGRYGEEPPVDYLTDFLPRPGRPEVADPLARLKYDGVLTQQLDSVRSYLHDGPRGLGIVALDASGRPLIMGHGIAGGEVDHPYEIDLVTSTRDARIAVDDDAAMALDRPFSLAELERLLRARDRDVQSIPTRLARLAPSLLTGSDSDGRPLHLQVTTHSMEVPIAANGIDRKLIAAMDNSAVFTNGFANMSVVDLLRAKMRKATGNTPSRQQLNYAIKQLFGTGTVEWPDLFAGLRMNVNRPFGNHADDNENNVIYEPGEGAQPWYTGDPNVEMHLTLGASIEARQLYCRQLYVLIMLLMDDDYVPPSLTGIAATDDRVMRERARLAAQWAVNVVDFRDRDSICTPFVYDAQPFRDFNSDENYWDAGAFTHDDGTPNFDWTTSPGHPSTNAWVRVVWGVERPELLISETLATHDRNTEDLALTTGDGQSTPDLRTDDPDEDKRDKDFDQRMPPEGSLFIELVNPWRVGAYDQASGSWVRKNDTPAEIGGNLTEGMVTQRGVNLGAVAGETPVWRLLILKPYDHNGGAYTAPAYHDPDSPDPSERPDNSEIERSVYFVTQRPANVGTDGEAFYLSANHPQPVVAPGRYAVIGPSLNTRFGHLAPNYTTIDTAGGLRLNPNATPNLVEVVNNAGPDTNLSQYPTAGTDIQPPLAIVVSQPRRLSVSEPVTGDPISPAGAGGYPPTQDGVYAWSADALNTKEPDVPLDLRRAYEFTADTDGNEEDTSSVGNPRNGGEWLPLLNTGTTTAFRMVHLQRLANPLAPHDAIRNPYLTIDSMPVDLVAYNGKEDDSEDRNIEERTLAFATRQRGESGNLFWASEWRIDGTATKTLTASVPVPAGGASGPQEPFPYQLQHSLGFVNYLHYGGPDDGTVTEIGDPANALPWFHWPNRPVVHPVEMLMAPAVHSSALLRQFTPWPDTGTPALPYEPGPDADTAVLSCRLPFQHLLNPFQHSHSVGGTTHYGPGFFRLLEWLENPSPFAATEHVLPTALLDQNDAHPFLPPYNRVPRYRVPGKINLNTINSKEVFKALVGDVLTKTAGTDPDELIDELWERFVQSRQGYVAPSDAVNFPSSFSNPFRPAAFNTIVPIAGMQKLDAANQPRDVDVTLLRSDPTNDQRPLFAFDSLLVPAGNTDVLGPYNDPERNPYFRYQLLARLANNTTTRSSVFAVWITLGYFEVTPTSDSAVLNNVPDGYQIGKELGIDRGAVKRHRAFFIIDRSVPVGFRRGENLNTENVVLLRRYLE